MFNSLSWKTKPSHGSAHVQTQPWAHGDRRVLVAHWPTSLDYLVNSRPVRDPFSRNTLRKQTRWMVPEEWQSRLFSGPHNTCICVYEHLYTYVYLHMQTHINTHTVIKGVGWTKESLATYGNGLSLLPLGIKRKWRPGWGRAILTAAMRDVVEKEQQCDG